MAENASDLVRVLKLSGEEVATLEIPSGTRVLDVKRRLATDPDLLQLVQDGRDLHNDEPVAAGQLVMVERLVPLPVLHVPTSSTPECLDQAFDVSDRFTMCAFVKVASPNSSQGGRILAKRDGGTGWEFAAPRWNRRASFYSQKKSHHNVGQTRVDDGSEHHVAVTFADGVLKVYVDGRFDGQMAFSIEPAPGVSLWTRARGGTADPLIGEVRDIMAWNQQLSDEQIANLHQQGQR